MPPRVTQVPVPTKSRATVPTTTTHSISGRAVDPATASTARKRVCLYGHNGRGKTSLAAQFPKPLLLVSFEPSPTGGVGSIRNVPGVSVLRYGVEFQTVAEVLSLVTPDAVRAEGFETVVTDGATSLQRRILEELMREQGRHLSQSPRFGEVPEGLYPIRSDKTKAALAEFFDLPCTVVVTAKEKDHNPPREYNEKGKLVVDMRPKETRGMGSASWVAPEVSATVASWLVDLCPFTFRLYAAEHHDRVENPLVPGEYTEVPTGRFEVRARIKPHENYQCRGQYPDPETVPESVGGSTAAALYAEIAKLIDL